LALPVLALACASAGPPPRETAHPAYCPAAVERIIALRENGESLAAVAKEVGGTREGVRNAERQELARRRAERR
jgi:hypothetical protein